MGTTALFPGTFDPITYGHIDLLGRACQLFERVIVTIAVNSSKRAVFTGDERVELIRRSIADKPWAGNVEIDQFQGLLIQYARQRGVGVLVRGVRQVSDFEYEFRMALTNRRLAPEVDTVFLMPNEQLTFISASLVREIAQWGGDLSSFVPDVVAEALQERFSHNSMHANKGGDPAG